MSFKDLQIKACYESGVDDIVEDYYVPVLGTAVQYDRITGFFSSSSMAVAARGLSDFIHNGGKMRLITSPRLNSDDIEIIQKVADNDPSLSLLDFGIDISNLVNEFEMNHVKALGWLLSSGLLEMKLAIVYNDDGSICDSETISEKGLFHQKVGILRDNQGNKISFSGSINETATAWVNNDEEFKVFKEWTDSQEYFIRDEKRFDEIWNGKRKNVKIYSLPNALKADIVKYSSDFDSESISLKKYRHHKAKHHSFRQDKALFYYQADALDKWRSNNYRLLFEMATGTGKTRTAIAGIKHLNETKSKLITIISTPQNTLSKQWKGEVEKQQLVFDQSEIIDGSILQWDSILTKMLLKNAAGFADHCVLFTTHSTASSEKFISAINDNLSKDVNVLFVGDETHWLGAKVLQKALLDRYNFRIGLSATPSRWFDDAGTLRLIDYYGSQSFEFTIKDALSQYNPITGKHFLVNYHYIISKVGLDDDESKQYCDTTAKISKLWNTKDRDTEKTLLLERLLEKRANIIKDARAKYGELERILTDLEKEGRIENMLIFVSPHQISDVLEILANRGLMFHKLTEKEGTKPDKRYGNKSEREHIIEKFKDKDYQVLVAIKCLDEGIDIPTADIGILMASSTNPREYVQRIGRIIRQAPGKKHARLYDICVDTLACLNADTAPLEKRIREKELVRLREISENSINSIEALRVINTL